MALSWSTLCSSSNREERRRRRKRTISLSFLCLTTTVVFFVVISTTATTESATTSLVVPEQESEGGGDNSGVLLLVKQQQQPRQQQLRNRKLSVEEEEDEAKIFDTKYTQEYLDEVEKHGSCLYPNLQETHALAARLHERGETLPKPIINLGMPRCGSTSLYSFFECGGFHASHYFCSDYGSKRCGTCMLSASRQGLDVLKECGNYDAFTQIDTEGLDACSFPQVNLLEEFHLSEPNATFVLPFRDIDHWIRSVKNFQLKKSHLHWNTKKLYHPPLKDILTGCHIDPILPVHKGERDDELVKFMCDHVTRVREFVAKHPSHTLVEFNVEGAHTSDVLSKLFGVSKECWRNVNNHHLEEEEKSLTRDILIKNGEVIYT